MMKLSQYTLETERLILRHFLVDDAKFMHRWASDKEVTKYLLWYPHTNIKQTEAFIKSVIDKSETHPYDWIIVEKSSGIPIGSIGIAKIDEHSHKCEVGYCLAKAYWQKGFASEALSAVLSFMLNTEGFKEVYATHDIDNPNSGKVMQKSGMTYYNTDKIYNPIKDEYITVHFYKIQK